MKTISGILLWGFMLVLSSSSCKKDKIQDSNLVTVNGQVFGCDVNDKPFIADRWDNGNNIPPVHVTFWYAFSKFSHLIASGDKENERVEIFLKSPLTIGRRELKFRTRPYPIETVQKDYGLYQIRYPYTEYITNDTLGGYVDIISVDTINQKIEARFEFTGTDRYTNNKVRVSKGYLKRN